jgi:ABC-type cobalamin transport system permease subunit
MEYVKPFLIGGTVIAGSKFAGNYASPALAPIIGGMPTGIIASFFLTSDKERREYFNGYAYSSLLLFFAVLFIHIASEHTKTSVDLISGVGFVVWGILSYALIKARGLDKK